MGGSAGGGAAGPDAGEPSARPGGRVALRDARAPRGASVGVVEGVREVPFAARGGEGARRHTGGHVAAVAVRRAVGGVGDRGTRAFCRRRVPADTTSLNSSSTLRALFSKHALPRRNFSQRTRVNVYSYFKEHVREIRAVHVCTNEINIFSV